MAKTEVSKDGHCKDRLLDTDMVETEVPFLHHIHAWNLLSLSGPCLEFKLVPSLNMKEMKVPNMVEIDGS